MKNTCASCKGLSVTKIIKTNNEKKPKWLEKMDYVVNFIEKNNKIKIKKQPNTDTTLILDVDEIKIEKKEVNRVWWAFKKDWDLLEKVNQIRAKKDVIVKKNNNLHSSQLSNSEKISFNKGKLFKLEPDQSNELYYKIII